MLASRSEEGRERARPIGAKLSVRPGSRPVNLAFQRRVALCKREALLDFHRVTA